MLSHPFRLLWLLPVVALCAYLLRRWRTPAGVRSEIWERLSRESRPARMRTVAFLRCLALVLWLLAWAGPRWGVERVKVERTSYDIVFAVDCSRSMLAEDLAPSRKLAARQELTELMHRLDGNRFGLVGFTDDAYVFCPLTRDSAAATLFLEQLDENMFAHQGTRLAAALQAAGSLFPGAGKGESGTRLVVLLSDGEDHGSHPEQAARELAARHITVYTVALGSSEGAPIPDGHGGMHTDRQGKVVQSKADEKTLREIALATHGRFFRLGSSADHLDGLVSAIQENERKRLAEEMSTRLRPQFSPFVLLGLLFLGLAQLLMPRVRVPS